MSYPIVALDAKEVKYVFDLLAAAAIELAKTERDIKVVSWNDLLGQLASRIPNEDARLLVLHRLSAWNVELLGLWNSNKKAGF
jgi:hypothetical protein